MYYLKFASHYIRQITSYIRLKLAMLPISITKFQMITILLQLLIKGNFLHDMITSSQKKSRLYSKQRSGKIDDYELVCYSKTLYFKANSRPQTLINLMYKTQEKNVKKSRESKKNTRKLTRRTPSTQTLIPFTS